MPWLSRIRLEQVKKKRIQVIFIIGHLQSTKLEFFHGDYKPENVFVKTSEIVERQFNAKITW